MIISHTRDSDEKETKHMENFTFYSPTYFVFGKETESEAGKYVKKFGGTKVLILKSSKERTI